MLSSQLIKGKCLFFVFLQAQRQQVFLGLGERGGSPACHLHGEGRQYEGGLQALLRWPAEGRTHRNMHDAVGHVDTGVE